MEELTEQELQDIQDALYLQELEDYVKTLSAPTPEQIAIYNRQIDLMEQIHDEVRLKYPHFMPPYVPEESDADYDKSKYLDIFYNVRLDGGENSGRMSDV
jgi:hypothetical protein